MATGQEFSDRGFLWDKKGRGQKDIVRGCQLAALGRGGKHHFQSLRVGLVLSAGEDRKGRMLDFPNG